MENSVKNYNFAPAQLSLNEKGLIDYNYTVSYGGAVIISCSSYFKSDYSGIQSEVINGQRVGIETALKAIAIPNEEKEEIVERILAHRRLTLDALSGKLDARKTSLTNQINVLSEKISYHAGQLAKISDEKQVKRQELNEMNDFQAPDISSLKREQAKKLIEAKKAELAEMLKLLETE
jgi:predicted HAD superfamily phosphohydrolase